MKASICSFIFSTVALSGVVWMWKPRLAEASIASGISAAIMICGIGLVTGRGMTVNRLEIVVLALPRNFFAGEQRHQDIERFIEALARFLDRLAHARHLIGEGAAPDAQYQPAFAEDVGLNGAAGEDPHVMQRQHADGGDDLDMARDGCNLHRHLQRVRHQQDVDEMMLGDRHAAITEPLDELCLRNHVGIEPVAAIAGVGIIGGKEVVEFHRKPRPFDA